MIAGMVPARCATVARRGGVDTAVGAARRTDGCGSVRFRSVVIPSTELLRDRSPEASSAFVVFGIAFGGGPPHTVLGGACSRGLSAGVAGGGGPSTAGGPHGDNIASSGGDLRGVVHGEHLVRTVATVVGVSAPPPLSFRTMPASGGGVRDGRGGSG